MTVLRTGGTSSPGAGSMLNVRFTSILPVKPVLSITRRPNKADKAPVIPSTPTFWALHLMFAAVPFVRLLHQRIGVPSADGRGGGALGLNSVQTVVDGGALIPPFDSVRKN